MTRYLRADTPERNEAAAQWGVQDLRRRPLVPSPAVYHFIVFAFDQPVVLGDGAFPLDIPEDLDGWALSAVEMNVVTPSTSGIVRCQVRNATNGNVDMLSTRVQVDATETHSRTAATQPVINQATATVSHADRLWVDVDDQGTGALGLYMVLEFTP